MADPLSKATCMSCLEGKTSFGYWTYMYTTSGSLTCSILTVMMITLTCFQKVSNVAAELLYLQTMQSSSFLDQVVPINYGWKDKENFTLISDHNGSLLRRQRRAMTIGHSTKGKEKAWYYGWNLYPGRSYLYGLPAARSLYSHLHCLTLRNEWTNAILEVFCQAPHEHAYASMYVQYLCACNGTHALPSSLAKSDLTHKRTQVACSPIALLPWLWFSLTEFWSLT